MSVNILTASGLINLSGDKVTKDTITSALGYVPADEEALPDIVDEFNGRISDISNELDDKAAATDLHDHHNKALLDAYTGDYADLTNKPDIVDDDSGVFYIVDSNGNIICTIDADGLHTVEVTLNGEKVSEKLASLSNTEIDTSNLVDLTSTQIISGSKTFTSPVSLQGGANIPSDKSLTWGGLLSLVASATGMTGQATLTLPQETGTLATQEWVGENQSDFSGNYEDLTGAPDITTDEDDNSLYIIDANGNIICKVDASGIRTTGLEVHGTSNFYGDAYLRTGKILADIDANPYKYNLPTQSGTLATQEWVSENPGGFSGTWVVADTATLLTGTITALAETETKYLLGYKYKTEITLAKTLTVPDLSKLQIATSSGILLLDAINSTYHGRIRLTESDTVNTMGMEFEDCYIDFTSGSVVTVYSKLRTVATSFSSTDVVTLYKLA